MKAIVGYKGKDGWRPVMFVSKGDEKILTILSYLTILAIIADLAFIVLGLMYGGGWWKALILSAIGTIGIVIAFGIVNTLIGWAGGGGYVR